MKSPNEEVHRKVFNILFEHFQKQEDKGKEFYFLTQEVDFSQEGGHQEGMGIAIRLAGRDAWRNFFSILINSKHQVFVCGNSDNDEEGVIKELFEYFIADKAHFMLKGAAYGGWGFYIFEVNTPSSNTLDSKLIYLLSQWPLLKGKIESILKSNDSLWFIQKSEFEKFLSTSPFYNTPKITDLHLHSFEIKNFKGIKHILIENLPQNARWIFLTGENGFGKTSVLQAIAAGLYGKYDSNGNQILPNESIVKISLQYFDIVSEIKFDSDGKSVHHFSTNPQKVLNLENLIELDFLNVIKSVLTTYGSSRLQISARTTKEALEKQSPPTYSLFNTDAVLLDIEQLLKDTNAYHPADFEQIISIFKELLPNLANIEIDASQKSIQVKYYEKDDEGNLVNEGVTFTQLAAGYRNIIAMVGDMIYRLSMKQEVTNLSDLEGIVIIDEIELHLHPKYQKRFVQKLTELFPKIQFIASTHSPIPLLGAPAETVILHVTRTEERGIEVEKLDIDFSVLTPNAILTSPIFGFQELIPESKPDSTMVRSEQTYQEVLFNEQLDKQIDDYLTEENKQELLNLLKK